MLYAYVGLLAGLLGIVVSVLLYLWVERQPLGTERMVEVWQAIREGAKAYMRRQLRTIISFSALMALVVTVAVYAGYRVRFIPVHPELEREVILESVLVGASVLLGSLASVAAAFLSMDASTRANVRTTEAARRGSWQALKTATLGGAVLGFSVPSISVFSLAALYLLLTKMFGGDPSSPLGIRMALGCMAGFAFGASLSALFAQVGGGIYTKAADVGADLVGKVEAGIPEDDPRNPAVIADQVGDNVGDCAGRGADIFESVTAETLGTMIVGWAVYFMLLNNGVPADKAVAFVLLPLLTGAVRVLATIPGVLVAAYQKRFSDPMEPMRNGVIVSAIATALGFFVVLKLLFPAAWLNFFLAALTGIGAAVIVVVTTNYYTGYRSRSVYEIAKASQASPALTILQGLAVGMRSTFIPMVVITIALMTSFYLGMKAPLPLASTGLGVAGLSIEAFVCGVFGTALATLGMLSLAGIVMTLDGAGPIADNAMGIAEMAGLEKDIRDRLEPLDALGNVTKALTKGFAMGSAALAALLLFQAFVQDYAARDPVTMVKAGGEYEISLEGFASSLHGFISRLVMIRPDILIGFLIGAMLPFLFSSLLIDAVTKASWFIVEEVRRQFRERPGILEWKEKPDYYRAVDISTKFALKNMSLPAVSVIVPPLVIGMLFGGPAVGALVLGATASAVVLAIMMMWGGAAWDNAKKFIESGHFGGKRSPAHAAAVVGDTVGDPLKDTAGPSLHIVIKLLNTISLVFIPVYMLWLMQAVIP